MESPKKAYEEIPPNLPETFPNQGKVPTYLKKRAITLAEEAKARLKVKEAKTFPPGT